jgi:hypothetical protein
VTVFSVTAAPAEPLTADKTALAGRWHLAGSPAFSSALAARLTSAGAVVSRDGEPGGDADQWIFLHGLEPAPSPEEADSRVRACFRDLRAFARDHGGKPGRAVIVLDTGGDFGLATDPGERAAIGAIAGLAKTAAREWPAVRTTVLDIGRRQPADAAEVILREISSTGSELEMGAAPGGARTTPRLAAMGSAGPSAGRLQPGGVWLVSGGARGVTALCLRSVARRSRQRFVILGRTPIEAAESAAEQTAATEAELYAVIRTESEARGETLSPAQMRARVARIRDRRDARDNCERLRALGSEVRYIAADIGDATAVARAAAEARAAWGPISGIIHAAGHLADKLLRDQTDEQFDAVYRTKVGGLRALLAATAEDPLDQLCVFSSVAARAGNPGQGAYAAANEALNKICQAESRRRAGRCRVRSINWGPWDGGMVTAALKAHFAARGVPLISPEAGAECFADLIASAPETVECVVGAGTGLPRALFP